MNEDNRKYAARTGMLLNFAGGCPAWVLVATYLTYFYTNVAGLDVAAVGTILFAAKIFDGVSDIYFGNMIDKTRTKMGVCRPWVLRMSVMALIFITLLFCVPTAGSIGKTGQYIFVFVSYTFATAVVWTIYQTAINTLPSYITRNSHERDIMYVWANIGNGVVTTGITLIMYKLVAALGNDQKAWILASIIIMALGMVIVMAGVALCRETVDPDKIARDAGDETGVSLGKAVIACFRNKYWWMLLLFVAFGTAVNVGTTTMSAYYSQYILGDRTLADILNSCFTFPLIAAAPVVGLVVKRVGKKAISMAGITFMAAGSLITIIFPYNFAMLCTATVIKGAGLGCTNAVYMAMLADSIEYGQWKTGVRSQAALIGVASAGTK